MDEANEWHNELPYMDWICESTREREHNTSSNDNNRAERTKNDMANGHRQIVAHTCWTEAAHSSTETRAEMPLQFSVGSETGH